MRRLVLLTALLCLLAAGLAAAAEGATRYTVRGAGYGHGIGMSQYGAYGFAREGHGYREILAHYYRGTELSPADTRTIRVLLGAGGPSAFSGATRVPGRRSLNPNRTYLVRPSGGGLELRTTRGSLIGRYPAPLAVDGDQGPVRLRGRAMNGIADGAYRGALEFRPRAGGGVLAVNALGLDDYVKGVVAGEMPSSWHEQALRAQSVAARSYALTTDAGGIAFDQYPDTRSQVYRGVAGETERTNAAVDATAGEVLRHEGRIAVTYFFSTSGGRTENVENVFYGSPPKPYLRSVESPYEGFSPKHRWRLAFSRAQMQARLRGLVKGSFRAVEVVRRGASPRVVRAEVVGSRGRTAVDGATLRARLGLFDTWAYYGRITTEPPPPVPPALARRASWLARLVRPRALTGVVEPRPPGARARIERRTRSGWRRAGLARTDARGRYAAPVSRRGVYRVRAGGFAGPPVRVR